MLRPILFFIKVGVLVFVAVWLTDHPGAVQIDWLGWRLDTSVGILLLLSLLVAALIAVIFGGYRWLWSLPGQIVSYQSTRRREKGLRALTQGLVAVAAGDRDEARRLAQSADNLLDEPALTMLLSAKAAELHGDDKAAETFFRSMLDHPETEFMGTRGLLDNALRRGDTDEAKKLVERAYRLRPETPWVIKAQLDIHIRDGKWSEALATLRQAASQRVMEVDEIERKRAALLLERAKTSLAEGDRDRAMEDAKRAYEADPALSPAAALYARRLLEDGKDRRARKLLEEAYRRTPRGELAEAWAELAGSSSAQEKARHMFKLVEWKPDHPGALAALAEAEINAGQFSDAKKHLEHAIGKRASRRLYRLMADLEQASTGDGEAARAWLNKAAEAPEDPSWRCDSCGTPHRDWVAVCSNCRSFETQRWRIPSGTAPAPLAELGEAPAEGGEGGADRAA
ncbi:MAG: heme biosynthesis protein HemY [Alphaproteobacteria bacterium]|nr:heme biosynthesis protein HemY [Alphaproteobacteria bacterium]